MPLVQGGTTNYSTIVRFLDTDGLPVEDLDETSTGLDLNYRRDGSTVTPISPASQTVNGTHTDGGFVHIHDGYYRVDLPDPAVAASVRGVLVTGSADNAIMIGTYIDISTSDWDTLVDDIWDEQISGHAAAGSVGRTLSLTATAANLTTMQGNVTDILADTADMQPKLGTPDTDVSADIAANLSAIQALNDISAADVWAATDALTDASIADAVWEEALADHSGTAGSTAEALDTAATASGSTPAEIADAVWAATEALTEAGIADAVWDETIGAHVGAGSTGKYLSDIFDDTDTALPDGIAPGSANGLLIAGTNAAVTIAGAGDALTLTSGSGSGSGLVIQGNANGIGARILGGSTGGAGLYVASQAGGAFGAQFVGSAGVEGLSATFTDPRLDNLDVALSDMAGGTDFDPDTDSLAAIRDQGDAAWITGGGGTAEQTAAAVWAATDRLTVAEIVDAVWDETVALTAADIVDAMFTTAAPEGYLDWGTDGTQEGSLSDILYTLYSIFGNIAFSGTAGSAHGLDGTTVVGTYTVDDSADPTLIARSG